MDHDTDDYTHKPAFNHEPMRPPRDGVVGEVVFTENWRQLMRETPDESEQPNAALEDILRHVRHEPDQRAATVAASLICWLGTNVGSSFLRSAGQARAKFTNPEEAYLVTWAWENARVRHVSHGLRVLEYCLIPAENYEDTDEHHVPRIVPPVSSQDLEVADDVVRWLAGPEGQEFLKKCEHEIERRKPEAALRHYLVHNANVDPTQVDQVVRLARQMAAAA